MASSHCNCCRSASTADCMSGILQLAGKLRAVERAGAMHLAERGRRRRLMLEAFELVLPTRTQFRHHAALDEGPAHGRRLALQLLQFGGIFGWQQVRNGRHQLRDLHQRTFQPAKRRRQRQRLARAVRRPAQEPPPGIARRYATDVRSHARIARGSGRKAVLFGVAATLRVRLIGHMSSVISRSRSRPGLWPAGGPCARRMALPTD